MTTTTVEKFLKAQPRVQNILLNIERSKKSYNNHLKFLDQVNNMKDGWSSIVEPSEKSLLYKMEHVEIYSVEYFSKFKSPFEYTTEDGPNLIMLQCTEKFEDYVKNIAKNGDCFIYDDHTYSIIKVGNPDTVVYIVKLLDNFPYWDRYEGVQAVFEYEVLNPISQRNILNIVNSHMLYAYNFTTTHYFYPEINNLLVDNLTKIITGRGMRVTINKTDLFMAKQGNRLVVGSSKLDVCYQFSHSVLIGDLNKWNETVRVNFRDVNSKSYNFRGKSVKFYDAYKLYRLYSKETDGQITDNGLMQVAIWLFNPGFTRFLLGKNKVWKLDESRQDQCINEYWGENFASTSVMLDSAIDLLSSTFRVFNVRDVAKLVALKEEKLDAKTPATYLYGDLNSDHNLFRGLVDYFKELMKESDSDDTNIETPEFDGASHTAILVEMYYYLLKCYELIRQNRPVAHRMKKNFVESYTPKAFADRLYAIYEKSVDVRDRKFISFMLSNSVYVKEYKLIAGDLNSVSYIDEFRYLGSHKLPIAAVSFSGTPTVYDNGTVVKNLTYLYENKHRSINNTPSDKLVDKLIQKRMEDMLSDTYEYCGHIVQYVPGIVAVNPTGRIQDMIYYSDFNSIILFSGEYYNYDADHVLCYDMETYALYAPEYHCYPSGNVEEVLVPITCDGEQLYYSKTGDYIDSYTEWHKARCASNPHYCINSRVIIL